MIEKWQNELRLHASEEKAKILSRFFKTGKGEYGEGDKFLGITVPVIRSVSRQHVDEPLDTVALLLHSPWHEDRMSALLTLVEKYRRHKGDREEIVRFYLTHLSQANNWDLIDLSAPKILGEHVKATADHSILYTLAESTDLWHQRASIVATLTLIRNHNFAPTIALAVKFLTHPHQLMHKATGWMLREVGKRHEPTLLTFLDRFAPQMTRTALRYAIERLTPTQRTHYLHLKR